jgi:Tol biopolymer transport system component
MPLAIGTRLGPYDIQGHIGEGGMGEVYRAVDTRLQREVAIKILPREVANDPDRVIRFEREGRATAALNHPNVVGIYDVGSTDDVTYVVEELLAGETLREKLQRGPLPLRKSLEYARQIAMGLAAAHEKGLAHRDLKPENVFVTTDGQVKILDFGLARALPGAPACGSIETFSAPVTAAGVLLGTIGYMAPEQARGLAVDHRADIFALGLVLYEMVTGTRAFRGQTTADTIAAILQSDPPAMMRSDASVPPALDLIVRRCLEKDPHDRFQSARDLAFALDAIAPRPTDPAHPAGIPTLRSRTWIGVAALGLVLVVIGSVIGWTVWRRGVEPERPLSVSIVLPTEFEMLGTPAVSPDGGSLALVAAGARGGPQLYLRRLDDAELHLLVNTEDADQPFWSADGTSLAFFARGKLWRTELAGGTPRILADVVSPRGGTWSRDNVIVFAPNGDDGLYRVSADGGPVTPFTTLDRNAGEISHRWPRFLPDGSHVAYMSRVAEAGPTRYFVTLAAGTGGAKRLFQAGSTGVFVGDLVLFERAGAVFAQRFDLDGLQVLGDPVRVVENAWDASYDVAGLVGFDAAANVLAVRPPDRRTQHLVWRDRSGHIIGDAGGRGSGDVTLSADGRRAVFTTMPALGADTGGTSVLDVARGTETQFNLPGMSTASPLWDPQGTRLTYSPVRSGTFDLYERGVTPGATETLLLHTDGMKAARSWSPDGRYLLFNGSDPRTKLDVFVLDQQAGRTARVFAGGPDDQLDGSFSPDGKFVAYVSTETGRAEVYVRAFDQRTVPVRISLDGGAQPQWNRNGRELFYIGSGQRLMAVPLTPADGSVAVGEPIALFRITWRTGAVSNIQIASDRVYAPAPGGDRFLVVTADGEADARFLTLLLHWTNIMTRR